jgi:hypothetical protein
MGFKKEDRIFKKKLENKINKFHDLHKSNINSHEFFCLLKDHDYKFAEKKALLALEKIIV